MNCCAVAKPIPELPPVTRATLPCSLPAMLYPHLRLSYGPHSCELAQQLQKLTHSDHVQSALKERKEFSVDDVRVRSNHAVREILVRLEGRILEQFCC